MNKYTKIIIASASLVLILALCLGIFACKKDDTTDNDGGTQSGDNIQIPGTQVGDGSENGDTEEGDDTVDIEINLGDLVGGDDKDDGIDPDDGKITYEEYWSWSAEEREEYFNSFASADEFFAWYNQVQDEYNNKQDSPVIGEDGSIDLGGN